MEVERLRKRADDRTARMAACEKVAAAAAAAEQEEVKVEGRKGSKRRGSYTAKQKLAVLEWYDAVCADPSIKGRIKAFELDHRSKSVPWTTITGKGGWGAPAERARLSKSCST